MTALTAQSGRMASRQFSEKNEKSSESETAQDDSAAQEYHPRRKLEYFRNPYGRLRFTPRQR